MTQFSNASMSSAAILFFYFLYCIYCSYPVGTIKYICGQQLTTIYLSILQLRVSEVLELHSQQFGVTLSEVLELHSQQFGVTLSEGVRKELADWSYTGALS